MTTVPAATVPVRNAMHQGIVSCDPDAPMRLVAQMMAQQRVHAIIVRDVEDDRRPVGIVSALDVAAAVAKGGELTAAEMLSSDVLTISSEASVEQAALLMAQHDIGHLVVIDDTGPKPVGIISSLDVARSYGS